MKKYIYLLIAFFSCIASYAQAWAMDEAAEDAEPLSSISVSGVILLAVLLLVCYFCIKFGRTLQSMPYSRYVEIRKKIVTRLFLISILIGGIIAVTFYGYRELVRIDAEEDLSKICQQCDVYLEEPFFEGKVDYVEIDCKDFDRPTSSSVDDWLFSWYTRMLRETDGFDHDGKDGSYFCYYLISAPQISLAWAKCVNDKFPSPEGPYLYRCIYRPQRIRYFTKTPNPEVDVRNSYLRFQEELLGEKSIETIENWDINYLNNLIDSRYYKINNVDDDVKLFFREGMKALTSDENASEFEYVTLNFGDYEILYSVWCLSKLGVVYKENLTDENDPMSWKEVYSIDLQKVLSRYGVLLGMIWLVFIVMFLRYKPYQD